MLVGLTGSIGAGKTTISKMLVNANYHVVDADKISKEIFCSDNITKKVVEIFGETIQSEDGKIERKKLRDLVFNNEDNRKKLDNLMQPLINEELLLKIKAVKKNEIVFFDIPLLYECNYDQHMDYVCVVFCDENTLLSRISNRDNTTIDKAKKILDAQLKQDIKINRADILINNSGSMEELVLQFNSMINFITSKQSLLNDL